MNKSESNKRVSARRASTESDLPPADQTGTIAKRVHARRASPESASGLSAQPVSSAHDSGDAAASAEPVTDVAAGLSLGAAASAPPSSVPPARARARRPRAKLSSQAQASQPSAADPAPGAQPAAASEPSASPQPARATQPAATSEASASPQPARATQPAATSEVSANPPPARATQPAAASEASASPQPAAASEPGANPQPAAASEASASPQPAAASEPSANPQPSTARESAEHAAFAAREAHGPAEIVEAARWSASLQPAQELPPSLDHADFADDFGLDPQYESKLRPWLDSLCERHFHVELYGAENIPAHGRALLVANHSRASVWDGIVLRAALRLHHPSGRMPRWLVDDQQFHAPFLGTIVNRLGAVRACQENAERLLLREELVAVFPEGSKATGRPYEQRYRLQRFGRGGYVKLALRTGTPVFPVAIVATEHEGAVWRNRLANASRVLSAPFAALRPGFPRIGMLGVPPISARIRIYVGASIAEISRQDASVTHDDGLVHELNECVRSAVQNLVNASLHA